MDECGFEFAHGSSSSLIFLKIPVTDAGLVAVQNGREGKARHCIYFKYLVHLLEAYYLSATWLDNPKRLTTLFTLCPRKLRHRSAVIGINLCSEAVGKTS